MVRRKIPGSRGGGRNGYEVGYCKPPTHSQFQPGRSGNPAGRRKGLRNLATDVKRMLATTVKVKEGGRTRTLSTQETLLRVLREKALGGDQRALDLLLGLAGVSTPMVSRSEPPRRCPPMTKPSSLPTWTRPPRRPRQTNPLTIRP
jgi:Family of unknown function (DUF5681)